MLASRLLSILMLLQARGCLSATALAREFEVSVRTIHRDIDQLSAAGIPVYAERGRAGGFRLMDGYRTKLTGLTQAEAETLFLAGLPGPAAQLGLSGLLSAARLKLLAALPANMASDAERIAARFHLDPAPWFRTSGSLPALQTVARAVWREHFLTLAYRPTGAKTERARKLGPLGLVLKAGTWYLVAQSGKQIRTYRVAGITDATASDEPFVRPKDFDLVAHWERAARDYEAGVWRGHADVRLSPRGRELLALLGAHVEAAAHETARPERNGWTRCRIPIESEDHAVGDFMRLGEEVEVLAPASLRARFAHTAGLLARRHASRARRS